YTTLFRSGGAGRRRGGRVRLAFGLAEFVARGPLPRRLRLDRRVHGVQLAPPGPVAGEGLDVRVREPGRRGLPRLGVRRRGHHAAGTPCRRGDPRGGRADHGSPRPRASPAGAIVRPRGWRARLAAGEAEEGRLSGGPRRTLLAWSPAPDRPEAPA